MCCLAGIAAPERADARRRSADARGFFSGWGIRTVAEGEARYNPISYHNGSVWPHDNALIAMGFARYGLKEPLLRVLTGLFDAALILDLRSRLPELFCGFSATAGVGPDRLSGGVHRPRPGPRRRCSRCSAPRLASRSRPKRTRSASVRRCCRPGSKEIRLSNLRLGTLPPIWCCAAARKASPVTFSARTANLASFSRSDR